MHTTTSMSKIHPGIPSCSASGRTSTNGLQNATSTQNGARSGIATWKINIIMPVAASARA
eukprot:jgi/Chrpa1/5526/Chrysochromulina_OHIO_Genome00011166-RA